MGRNASVVAWRRLTGGITSSIHRLTLDVGSDQPLHLVLRRWLPASDEWDSWARTAIEQEAHVLDALPAHRIPAPRLVARTDGSATGGVPALLMTRAPGRMLLTPAQPRDWLVRMAKMLARIHNAPIDAPPWQPWTDVTKLEVPDGFPSPEVRRAAIAAVQALPDDPPSCFIHRDYQHFNLLWQREKLTSVVDWVSGSTGPPEIDVGHCRLNLAVLFSAQWAEEFRQAYEAESGRVVDARWDILSLLSYDDGWKRFIPIQVAGRTQVDIAGMDERVAETLAAAVERL